jgi:hypothetical protein
MHALTCHHEGVLDPLPAAQIGEILQQRLSGAKDMWLPDVSPAMGQKAASTYA